MPFSVQNLPWGKDALTGISARTNEVHHDKLYAGYVAKRNEIEEALKTADRAKVAATYSPYRALKLEETFNADGQILHELYFDSLGGNGAAVPGAFDDQVKKDFGSWDDFIEDALACAMAARGWMITAWDPTDGRVRNFLADAHNHGGVWGAVPLWTIDCYEHAYFIDFGSDRKTYLTTVLQNVNWEKVNARFQAIAK